MRYLLLISCLFLVACFSSCRNQDVRTETIKVPGMKNETCGRIIGSAIMRLPGLDPRNPNTLSFNLRDGTVSVTYDSMVIARKNIEGAIADAGFAANDIPADAKAAAALPPDCR